MTLASSGAKFLSNPTARPGQTYLNYSLPHKFAYFCGHNLKGLDVTLKSKKMNQTKQTIYKPAQQEYQNELRRIKEAGLSPENLEIMARFHEYLFSKGNGYGRVTKLSLELRKLCKMLTGMGINKPLTLLERNDIIKLVSHINLNPSHTDNTKHDYRRLVKQFYYWYEDEDPRLESDQKDSVSKMYKYIRKEMKKKGTENKADPNTIISKEELRTVLEKGCRNQYQKAFISLLHETGARIGEFLQLKIGHVQPREPITKIFLPQGKTIPREVYSFDSWPYLKAYIDNHPRKDNPDAYLWVSQSNRNRDELVAYPGVKKMIGLCFQRAGVSKKCNPHWFRHSRATIWSVEHSTQILCKLMGWSLNGRQVKNYVHLSQAHVEKDFYRANGIRTGDDEVPLVVQCICGTQNPSTTSCCVKCLRPLTLKDAVNQDKVRNEEISKTINYLMNLAQDPEAWADFQKFKRMKQE